MTKYNSKPVEVMAGVWEKLGDVPEADVVDWANMDISECSMCNERMIMHGALTTLGGVQLVCPNDWIVYDGKGYNSMKPNAFEELYESLTNA